MDTNPPSEFLSAEISLDPKARAIGLTPNYAALALEHTIHGNVAIAERCLRMIPRTQRGRVNIALEDLAMQLSRLGN